MGKYLKFLVYLSYAFGALWFIATAIEFAIGSINLGEMRVDLGVIALLQLLSAILAYIAWPHIDYATVRKMTHKSAREDMFKREKSAKGGAFKYVLLCLMMVAIQLGMLYAYKLSPRVYDLFSDSRQLIYQLSEDKESYEVIGVYRGTSSYVNVPSVYNNKPVTAIKEGALSNDLFYENNKVDKIDIGTVTVDDDGNETIVSYVQLLESGAISNDKILTLKLPASVTKIEKGAIKSSSLKTVSYEAKADFSYSYLNCSSLKTVTFEGTEAGKIVSLEGMSNEVKLEVSKENYDNYRAKNKEYMSSIRPILDANEYVIDFYTNSDYYIDSIIVSDGSTTNLSYQMLKNDSEAYKQMIPPTVDTLAYINDRHELGTAGAKVDSAFRGWYFDPSYTDECLFTESGTVSLNGNYSIYAKWIPEYTGTLDWGTYHYPDQPPTVYWTDEDLIKFPVITDRDGFKEGIRWTVDDQIVTTSQNISKSVTVKGTWIFDKPTIDIIPSAQKDGDDQFKITPDKDGVSFTYDETQKLNMFAQISHGMEGKDGFSCSTNCSVLWSKEGDSNYSDANANVSIQNVKQSGVYVLTVEARSTYGDISTESTIINVEIAPKPLDIGTATLVSNYTAVYNAQNQKISYTGTFVHDGIETLYTYYDADGNVIAPESVSNVGVKNVGSYRVEALFRKLDTTERDNYGIRTREAELVISPFELDFVSWSSNEFEYNANERSVKLNVSGIFPGDYVDFVYEGNKATNAGTYVASATGVTNNNYSISNISIANKCTHEWKINPKTVSVKEWRIDGSNTATFKITYDGEEHSIVAIPEGVFTTDQATFEFVYDTSANTIAATNANKYTAKIIDVKNKNYKLTEGSTREWEIEKKLIDVSFSEGLGITYNAKQQGVTATVTGIAEKDLELFKRESFLYTGKSDAITVASPVIDGANLIIAFTAKDAASYKAQISGINSAADVNLNYTVNATFRDFTIAPKPITFVENDASTVYTGQNQTLELIVNGIEAADLDNVTYGQFTSDTLKSGKKGEGCYILTLTGKDAAAYSYSVTAFANTNYSMSAQSGTLDIAKKTLSVAWEITDLAENETEALVAGAQYIYNAIGYKVNAKIIGVVSGETVELDYTGAEGKNASNYTTNVSLPESYKNYSFSATSIGWKINPYELDFKWSFNDKQESVKDGVGPTFIYSAKNVEVKPVYELLGTDTVSITYVSGKGDLVKQDATTGTYKVEISSLGNNNYVIGDNASFTWKIDPKVVTVEWVSANAKSTYNGTYTGPQFTVSGILDTDRQLYITANVDNVRIPATNDDDTVYNYNITELIIDAGTYECTVDKIYKPTGTSSYSVDDNYVVKCEEVGTYTVDKAPLTLAGWMVTNNGSTNAYKSTTDLVYNRYNYTITNSIKEALFKRNGTTDSVSLSYHNNTQINYVAGGYTTTVSLTGAHSANYYIKSETSLSWSIKQKEITVTWVSNDFYYNGNNRVQEVSYQSGATSNTDGKVYTGDDLSFSYDNYIKTDAGKYTAKLTGIGNSNYKLASGVSTSYAWEIKPQEVQYSLLKWDTTSFTYNGEVQYPKAYYEDTARGRNIYIGEYTGDISKKDAKEGYKIGAKSFDNSNYKLVGIPASPSVTYTINPKVVSFTWSVENNGSKSSATSYTYNSKQFTVTATPNVIGSDTCTVIYGSTRTFTDAETYTVTVTGLGNSNYALPSASQCEKTITVNPITIQFGWRYSGSTAEASGFTYDGKAKTIGAYIKNLCSGDIVTFIYDRELTLKDADTYTFTVTGLGGADNGNYQLPTSLSNRQKTITVSPQELTLTWSGNTSVTYDGYDKEIIATLEGKINGTKVTVNPVYVDSNGVEYSNPFVDAGSYKIYVAIGTSSNSNFKASNFKLPSNNYKTLTISPQTLTITWAGSDTVIYDGQSHSRVATVKGKIKGVTYTFTPGYSSGTNSAINYKSGGYTFTVSSFSSDREDFKASNFQIPSDKKNAYLTINKQAVSISWPTATEITYDGYSHSLVPTVKGASDGKTVSASYTTGTIINVGSKIYSVNSVNDSNYTLDGATNTSKTLTINPQKVTITWSGATSVTYDANYHYLTPTVKGANDGKTVGSVSYDYSSGARDAGTYTVKITSINSNYTLDGATNTSKTLTINPQRVTITWRLDGSTNISGNAHSVIYDASSHSLAPIVKGESSGTTLSGVTYTTGSITHVGSRRYEVTNLNNSNYTLVGAPDTSATLTVVKCEITVVWSISSGSGVTWNGDKVSAYYRSGGYTLTATMTNQNGVQFTRTYTKTSRGTYEIDLVPTSFTGLGTNYEIVTGYERVTLTIS